MKDYYTILAVTPESDDDEIRRSYRKLAMQYHPDRNPDDPNAEERFKEIAEAYGVLTDPEKRRQYDAARAGRGAWSSADGTDGFNYSQDDILRDLFRDPRFQQMFQSLLRDFQRSGFRANQHFIRKSFFGGRGGFLLGGLFLFGSLAGPALLKTAGKSVPKSLPKKSSFLGTIRSAVGSLVGSSEPQKHDEKAPQQKNLDVTYITGLTSRELDQGKIIQVVTQGPDGQEMLRVTIPPGSRDGQKLRLKGKGAVDSKRRGDLYLQLAEQ